MSIKRKSPPEIQAQIATYTARHIENYVDKEYVLGGIGMLATQELFDITRSAGAFEMRKDDKGRYDTVAFGTPLTVATADQYVDFMRSADYSTREEIRNRAMLLEKYNEEFKPIVSDLRNTLARQETAGQAGPLGLGGLSAVYRITHDSIDYAVRIPGMAFSSTIEIDKHIAGALAAKGIPHLEQIVAASYEDGVTIAEIMPGKDMRDITNGDLRQVTNQQLEGLIETIVAAHARSVYIDPSAGNILYDRDEGFGIIDITSNKMSTLSSRFHQLGLTIGDVSDAIFKYDQEEILAPGYRSTYGSWSHPDVTKEVADGVRLRIDLLTALVLIIDRHLDGEDYKVASQHLTMRLAEKQKLLT